MLGVTVAIWWRNHDILGDLYDYSSVIAAAGKIEAGLKPYVDFRSTMQSSTYLLNRAAELAFGRNYLGLTGGGLVVSLFGTVALFALWRRTFGLLGGLALTAAVVWAGLAQHVVVFYNTIGILCVAIVVTGVAYCPRFSKPWAWDQALVLGALVLGGMNKLNFQFLGLALAAVLVVEAQVAARISRRDMLVSLLVLAGAGIVIPWVGEWWWTGATPALWFENLVTLAGERVDSWHRLAEPMIYAGPAYDLHHHIPFKHLTAAGLLLLAGVGYRAWRVMWSASRAGKQRSAGGAVLLVYVMGAALGGVLLTITNVETITLTSLAFVIAAAALWIAGVAPAGPTRAGVAGLAWLVPAAGLFWAVDGGIAAWNGSRILYSSKNVDRSVFERVQGGPPALRYFAGVRLDANLHHSLLLVTRELDHLQSRRGNLSGVMFGPAFEWLERAYPETIMRGMPVWYHVGTSLRADDGEWLVEQLARHRVDRILAHPGWEIWPAGFQAMLTRDYQSIPLGTIARLHEKIVGEQSSLPSGSPGVQEPLAIVERTGSNLHLLGSPVPEGFGYFTSPWGDYLGREGGWTWNWTSGLAIVEGQIVGQRLGDSVQPGHFTVRISTIEAQGPGVELWRATATIEAGLAWARLPFRITPYGRPVQIHVEPIDGVSQVWHFGCREVQIRQTINLAEQNPPPTVVAADGKAVQWPDGKQGWFRSMDPLSADPTTGLHSPFEMWIDRRNDSSTPWRVKLEIEPAESANGTPPVMMLLWYRSGRIELLSQQVIDPQGPKEISVEGWMVESGGWIGVAVRSLEKGKNFNVKVRVKEWHF